MKKLIVDRTEFINQEFNVDSNSDAISLAEWVVSELIYNGGKVNIDIDKIFNNQEHIPIYMIEIEDEDLAERMDNSGDGELPLKFEFEGINYELELEK